MADIPRILTTEQVAAAFVQGCRSAGWGETEALAAFDWWLAEYSSGVVADALWQYGAEQVLPAQARAEQYAQLRRLLDEPEMGPDLPTGLCWDRDDHEPHEYSSASLGKFWCTADQSRRLPYAVDG